MKSRAERIAELRATIRGCTSKDCRWYGPCDRARRELEALLREENEVTEVDLADVCFG